MSEPIVFLPLSQGKVAVIDFADFEKVGRVKWYARCNRKGRNFYARRNVQHGKKRMTLLLHCEILGVKWIDHKNGDGLDCRRENLRPATAQQNQKAFCRKRLGSFSKFRGVGWHKKNLKWLARIGTNGVRFHLGYFEIEEDAARAYDKKAKELGFFKEALNFQ